MTSFQAGPPPGASGGTPSASTPSKQSSKHKLVDLKPLSLLALLADGGGAVAFILSQPLIIMTGLSLLGLVLSATVLLKRRKTHLDLVNGLAVSALALSVGLLVFLVPQAYSQQQASSAAPANPTPTGSSTATSSSGGAAPAATQPAQLIYSGSPTLKLAEGIDFENHGTITPDLTGANDAIDLFLGTSYGVMQLMPNANHNELFTYTPSSEPSPDNCRDLMRQGSGSAYTYVIAGEAYCFITSDSHLGYLQVVQNLSNPSAAVVKVRVWNVTSDK